MRALPIGAEPFAGETVRSLYRRLAERNAIPPGELWTIIRHRQPRLPLKTTPELVPRLVEQLGALPHRFFDGRREDRLFVRCVHTQWRHTNCTRCAPLPAPVAMCRRCARGQRVDVRTRTGAACTRHRRWHYAGADESLNQSVAHLRAERCLVGPLWKRGVALSTGELELAAELLVFQRGGTQDHHELATHEARLHQFYPEAVRLTALLTEPWAERYLANTRLGHAPVAALVEAAVTAVETRSERRLALIRESFHTEDRETFITLNRTVRLRYGRSPGLGELGARILRIAPRVRATFLRHADARHPPTGREHHPPHSDAA